MSICLNMIVKNEEKVIGRCLKSIKNIIDSWVIVDTGSQDSTKEVILNILKDIPGELYERKWVDFSYNRNEALILAQKKSDYILLIDADDFILFDDDFKLPALTKDFYILIQKDRQGGVESRCPFLIKSSLPWKWEGTLHEGLVCPEVQSVELLKGAVNIYGSDGHRSQDSQKLLEIIETLKKHHHASPTDSKTVFYLAESYRGAQKYQEAIEMYEKRISLGGFSEEIFWSLYCIAKMQAALGFEVQIVLNNYINSHAFRPTRMEPIYDIIDLYRKNKNIESAYSLAKKYHREPFSQDVIFVSRWVYEWGILWQYALCCLDLNRKEEFIYCKDILLSVSSLPEHLKNAIIVI